MINRFKNSISNNIGNSIGIIGCGWLGTALAEELLKNNIAVQVTVTNETKVDLLAKKNIEANILTLPSMPALLNKHPIFNQQKIVICFPPQLKNQQQDYPEKIAQCVFAAEQNGVSEIILISTSSIYNGLSGKVTEQTKLNFSAKKVSILNEAEQQLTLFSGKATIIRFAGLIGPERHPGRFLLKKSCFENPDGIINLIHQQDAVGIILTLLKRPSLTNIVDDKKTNAITVYNGASATHCTREQFYQKAAAAINLPFPHFKKPLSPVLSKEICSDHVRKSLSYQFIFDDLLAWLEYSL